MKHSSLARQISFGLIDTGVDLVLAGTALGLNLLGSNIYHPKNPITMLKDSYKLTKIFKKQFLTKTSYYARKRGWLEKKHGELVLTDLGREHLSGKIPVYKKHRPWDGFLYLITYDIAESSRWWRDRLRFKLYDGGAKMIQQSVWLSVVDLSKEMKIFQGDLKENGTILVSTLKRGEGVGQEKINSLIERLYHLDDLNKQYFEFIQLAKNKNLTVEEQSILKLKYLSVLSKDPQLPKDLLPFVWYGDEAFKYYTKLTYGRRWI